MAIQFQKRPNFRGRSLHRLDSKGRLRIPTKFREVLQTHYSDALIVASFGNYLAAYPLEKWWDEIESKAMNLSEVLPEHRSFLRSFVSSAEECEFDNQGRILIPPMLRLEAGIETEVVLAGMLTNFEIWKKETWETQAADDKRDRQKILESVAGAGL